MTKLCIKIHMKSDEIRLCYLISVSLEIRFRRVQITACSYYTQGLGHSLG